MLTRRKFLEVGAGLSVVASLPFASHAFAASSVARGMKESDLVYLSPIKSDGNLSRCQAEVWFVEHDGAMFVCTGTESWRARAPRQGLDQARVWVGDVGVWTRSNGEYRNLPSADAAVDIVEDDALIETLLDAFGDKYPVSWVVYNSRFREGLADGSRTMLRYQPLS